MSKEQAVTVDFVAKGDSPDEWKMVLVEEGPWDGPIDVALRRIQDRLYGCIDAAVDGQLAESFPKTQGKKVIVQLDCYNVPESEVADFFERFSAGVFAIENYRLALEQSQFVSDIGFQLNFDNIH
jgi:hypothetical protein